MTTVRDLLVDVLDLDVEELERLTIMWTGSDLRRSGWFEYDYQIWDGGAAHYTGVHHPDGGSCVGEGICTYCGRTLWDW